VRIVFRSVAGDVVLPCATIEAEQGSDDD
jgi:hypothetical protein